MKKKKILIIYNKIWEYRIRIFELLNLEYDLTVGYSDPAFINKTYSFKTLYLPVFRLGPFEIHKNRLNKLSRKYDAVVGLGDSRWLRLMSLGFNPFRKYGLVLWGIGLSASYTNRFGVKKRWDRVRYCFAKRADAILFYSTYPIDVYVKAGIVREKLFVAHNTVYAPYTINDNELKRNSLLFIGTLYPQKRIDYLLQAYLELKKSGRQILPINIVGGGPDYNNINKWIKDNSMENDIIMHGPIYEGEQLERIFRSSVACISPDQAGLSILSCMAYGVAFVTSNNAITGGEIFNIKNGETGLLFDGTIEDLKKTIIYIHEEPTEIKRIGENALLHYNNNRTPEIMAQGLKDAIEYSIGRVNHVQ